MGILNVTPDSFSDGGRFDAVDAAVEHARAMVSEGATIIDIGGESTRPGAAAVSVSTELARVLPVVEAVADLGVTISIDTRRAEVARRAVDAGAGIINDVSASLWETAADLGVGWVAMHMAGEPATMQDDPTYVDVVAEVFSALVERGERARAAGVSEVWIDPGFGFGKTARHNLELVAAIDEFVSSPFPVVLGASRKRTLGLMTAYAALLADPPGPRGPRDVDELEQLEASDADDRVEASLAVAVWAMRAGVQVLRVHDVAAHVAAARVVFGVEWDEAA